MGKTFYLDMLERCGWTFVQTGAAVAISAGGFGVDVWKAAAIAGGIAVCKALVASRIGKRTAALPDTT